MPINIPIVSALPDIVEIYSIAPWIWDGIIICLVLGLLLREGVKKAKIVEDDKQAGKLGGVIGFALGLILLLGMYRKGWQLIDIWPVLLVILAIFLAILLWKYLVETFGEKNKWIITILVIAIAIIVIGLLLGSIPEYITGILGGFGFYLLLMLFWGAILFVLIFLLFGGLGGGERGARGGGLGGILDRAGAAIKFGVNDIAKPLLGKGWEDVIKPGAKGTWDYIIKPGAGLIGWSAKGIWWGIGTLLYGIGQLLGQIAQKRKDLKKSTNDLRAAIKAVKAAAEELKKKKDAMMEELQNIAKKIDAATDPEIRKYSQVVASYIPIIKTAYTNFMKQKLTEDFERCQRQFLEIRDLIEKLLIDIKKLMDGIRAMRTETVKITDANLKSQFSNDCETCWNAASALDQELRSAHDALIKEITEAIKDANLPQIERLFVNISDEKRKLDTFLPTIVSLLNEAVGKTGPDAARIKNDIKQNCQNAINACTRLNERIKTLAEDYLKYTSIAIDAFEAALDKDLAIDDKTNKFAALDKAVKELSQKMGAQLIKEGAAEEARKRGIADVSRVLMDIEAERRMLLALLKNLIKITDAAENKIRAALGTAEEFPNDPARAEQLLVAGLNGAKTACAAEEKELQQAQTKIKDAAKTIIRATKDLDVLLKAETGFALPDKSKIQDILSNLNKFIQTNEHIDKLLKLFDYKLFMTKTLSDRINEKRSMNIKAFFMQIYTEILRLQKLVEGLGIEESILRKLEEEEFPTTPY